MIRVLSKSVQILLVVIAITPGWSTAQNSAGKKTASVNDESLPVGDWRGDSICQVRPSACHDEDSLYHVTKIADRPGWFSMQLDKIVDGKPVTMGTMECSYEAAKQTLECVFPRGVMRFTVTEKTMQGAMLLPDNTLWRKISLKKVVEEKNKKIGTGVIEVLRKEPLVRA